MTPGIPDSWLPESTSEIPLSERKKLCSLRAGACESAELTKMTSNFVPNTTMPNLVYLENRELNHVGRSLDQMNLLACVIKKGFNRDSDRKWAEIQQLKNKMKDGILNRANGPDNYQDLFPNGFAKKCGPNTSCSYFLSDPLFPINYGFLSWFPKNETNAECLVTTIAKCAPGRIPS